MTGVAGVVGNVGAGVILQLTDPTGLFVVFAVLAAAVLIATAWCTPSIAGHQQRLDPVGTLLLIAALVSRARRDHRGAVARLGIRARARRAGGRRGAAGGVRRL